MDTPMLWRLIGAFINVTLLSRGAHLLLRKWVKDSYRRAYVVMIIVALLDFAGVWALYRDFVTSFYVMLFYYIPLILLWFLKDMLEASRTKGRASRSTE